MDAPEDLLRQVDERLTFILPAPRDLFDAFHGDATDPKNHRWCLGDLRHVRDSIATCPVQSPDRTVCFFAQHPKALNPKP